MARRRYTDDERTEALALYAKAGPTAVQEAMGIPKATVTGWAKAAGVGTVRNEQTAAATEAARLDWEQRRLTMAHRIGEVAEAALDRVQDIVEQAAMIERTDMTGEPMVVIADGAQAKHYATTLGILIDKAQVLSGGATGRIEHRTASIDDEVARLAAELAIVPAAEPSGAQ